MIRFFWVLFFLVVLRSGFLANREVFFLSFGKDWLFIRVIYVMCLVMFRIVIEIWFIGFSIYVD